MNYLNLLENILAPGLSSLITTLGELGQSQGSPLFLVGGRVRDLLLGNDGGDLDLVVEGDAPALAQALLRDQGGEVVSHLRFGTANYRQGDLSIDLATARTETYPRPGALPVVRPGSIEDDLYRRDFTVNAMAIGLSPPEAGAILDPFDGRRDLREKQIRVLHDKSFVDDPTRIMRAIRYEQRLGFRIEASTLTYLRRDLDRLPTVGVDRLRHELELFFLEKRPELALRRADELGVLREMDPSLQAGDRLSEEYQATRTDGSSVDSSVYLALLLYEMDVTEAENFVSGYRFTREQTRAVIDALKLKDLEEHLGTPGLRRSEVYHLLKGLRPESIQAFRIAANDKTAKNRAKEYTDELSLMGIALNGSDLLAMKVPPGPEIGRLLGHLLDARLDGLAKSREDEEVLVRQWNTGPD